LNFSEKERKKKFGPLKACLEKAKITWKGMHIEIRRALFSESLHCQRIRSKRALTKVSLAAWLTSRFFFTDQEKERTKKRLTVVRSLIAFSQ
jgi:hypothetical protein